MTDFWDDPENELNDPEHWKHESYRHATVVENGVTIHYWEEKYDDRQKAKSREYAINAYYRNLPLPSKGVIQAKLRALPPEEYARRLAEVDVPYKWQTNTEDYYPGWHLNIKGDGLLMARRNLNKAVPGKDKSPKVFFCHHSMYWFDAPTSTLQSAGNKGTAWCYVESNKRGNTEPESFWVPDELFAIAEQYPDVLMTIWATNKPRKVYDMKELRWETVYATVFVEFDTPENVHHKIGLTTTPSTDNEFQFPALVDPDALSGMTPKIQDGWVQMECIGERFVVVATTKMHKLMDYHGAPWMYRNTKVYRIPGWPGTYIRETVSKGEAITNIETGLCIFNHDRDTNRLVIDTSIMAIEKEYLDAKAEACANAIATSPKQGAFFSKQSWAPKLAKVLDKRLDFHEYAEDPATRCRGASEICPAVYSKMKKTDDPEALTYLINAFKACATKVEPN